MKWWIRIRCKIFGHKYVPIWGDETVKYTDKASIANFKFKCKHCGIVKT